MYSKDFNLTKILSINSNLEYTNLHFERFRTPYIGMNQQKQFKSLFTKSVGAQAFRNDVYHAIPFSFECKQKLPVPPKNPCETFLRVENSLTESCGIETGWEIQLYCIHIGSKFLCGLTSMLQKPAGRDTLYMLAGIVLIY